MYNLPTTASLHKQSGIPFGLVVSPLAELGIGEYPVAVVDHGPDGPIRCTRCRAYINPFVVWNSSGNMYTCMVCLKFIFQFDLIFLFSSVDKTMILHPIITVQLLMDNVKIFNLDLNYTEEAQNSLLQVKIPNRKEFCVPIFEV